MCRNAISGRKMNMALGAVLKVTCHRLAPLSREISPQTRLIRGAQSRPNSVALNGVEFTLAHSNGDAAVTPGAGVSKRTKFAGVLETEAARKNRMLSTRYRRNGGR